MDAAAATVAGTLAAAVGALSVNGSSLARGDTQLEVSAINRAQATDTICFIRLHPPDARVWTLN